MDVVCGCCMECDAIVDIDAIPIDDYDVIDNDGTMNCQ